MKYHLSFALYAHVFTMLMIVSFIVALHLQRLVCIWGVGMGNHPYRPFVIDNKFPVSSSRTIFIGLFWRRHA